MILSLHYYHTCTMLCFVKQILCDNFITYVLYKNQSIKDRYTLLKSTQIIGYTLQVWDKLTNQNAHVFSGWCENDVS